MKRRKKAGAKPAFKVKGKSYTQAQVIAALKAYDKKRKKKPGRKGAFGKRNLAGSKQKSASGKPVTLTTPGRKRQAVSRSNRKKYQVSELSNRSKGRRTFRDSREDQAIRASEQLKEAREYVRTQKAKVVSGKVVGKFRPKKSDRLSFVFLGIKGGRLVRDSEKKGYLVYIDSRGRKRVIGDYRKGAPQARRLFSFDLAGTGKKTAIKKWFGIRKASPDEKERTTEIIKTVSEKEDVRQIKVFKPSKREGHEGITFDRFSDGLAIGIRKYIDRLSTRKQLTIDVAAIVEDRETHELRTVIFKVGFAQRDYQFFNKATYKDFIMKKVYAFFAQSLKNWELVTVGSSQFIKKMKVNTGKKRSQWKDKKGELWEKNEFAEVIIKRMDYRINRVRQ